MRYLNNRSGVQFRMPNRPNPNLNTLFNYDGFLPPIGRQPNNVGMNNNHIDWTRYRNSIENFMNNLNTNFNMENIDDFNDVPIFPSNQQIENAVEIVRYGDMENNTTEQTVCPIDLTAFNEDDRIARIRHCGHCFKESNLRTWFASHSTCPICRYDIRDYVIMQDSNNTSGITNNITVISSVDSSNNSSEPLSSPITRESIEELESSEIIEDIDVSSNTDIITIDSIEQNVLGNEPQTINILSEPQDNTTEQSNNNEGQPNETPMEEQLIGNVLNSMFSAINAFQQQEPNLNINTGFTIHRMNYNQDASDTQTNDSDEEQR